MLLQRSSVDDVSNITCVVPPFSEQTQIANFLDRKTKQIPPKQEQVQIANFLDHKTGQIDELISAEQRKIELLKEYRQSLIFEVVTGKIDVRSEV